MTVRLDLDAHKAVEAEVARQCADIGCEFVPRSYHHDYPARTYENLASNYSIVATWIREQPDGVVVGPGVAFRAEIKTLKERATTHCIALLPAAHAYQNAQQWGDLTVYIFGRPNGLLNCWIPGVTGMPIKCAKFTERWGPSMRRWCERAAAVLATPLSDVRWNRQRSGDPFLVVEDRHIERCGLTLRRAIDLVRGTYTDTRDCRHANNISRRSPD